MKSVTVRDLQRQIRKCVDESQKDRMVVSRHGKPAAVLIGVEGCDWEDVLLATDPGFWKLIQARRKEKTVSMKEMRYRLTRKG